MTQLDDLRKNLETARQQLAEHMKYCDPCRAGWHCATRAELEQYISLAASWLTKQGK